MKIIEYNTVDNILIEFQDDYKFITKGTYRFFKKGIIKNPYDKRHKENRRKDKMKDKKGWSVFLLAVFFLNACGVSKKADVSPVKKETISWTVMLHTAAPPSGTIEEELENLKNYTRKVRKNLIISSIRDNGTIDYYKLQEVIM